MDYSTPITANTTGNGVRIAAPDGIRKSKWLATVFTGNTGGATVSLFLSPDNGATVVPAKNQAGTAYTTAVADAFNIETGCGRSNPPRMSLFAQVTGYTTPFTITVFDNA